MSGLAIMSMLYGYSNQCHTVGFFQQQLGFLFTFIVKMILFCVQGSAALAEDTPKQIGTASEVRSAAMTTVNSVAMTTASTAAAALFDVVEDSDSSASSDILQTSQVRFCKYMLSCLQLFSQFCCSCSHHLELSSSSHS